MKIVQTCLQSEWVFGEKENIGGIFSLLSDKSIGGIFFNYLMTSSSISVLGGKIQSFSIFAGCSELF